MRFEFKVIDDKAVARMLAEMPDKLFEGTLKRAAKASATVFADEVKAKAHRRSPKPDMADTIGPAVSVRKGQIVARVQAKGPHAYVWYFEEFGVSAHFIKAKDGGALKIGDHVIEGPVFHPGYGDHKFVRPAFDAKHDEALHAFSAVLQTELDKGIYGKPEPDDED